MDTADDDLIDESEYPLARLLDGSYFMPPSNAVAWRVRRVQRGWRGLDVVTWHNPHIRQWIPLVLRLRATPGDMMAAVEHSGLYRLDPIDRTGHVLAWEPGFVQVSDPRRHYSVNPRHTRYQPVTYPPCTVRRS